MSKPATSEALRQALSDHLASAFAPAPEQLPLQPSGKQLRTALGRASLWGRCIYMLTRYPPAAAICALLGGEGETATGRGRLTLPEARRIALGIVVRRQRNKVMKATALRSGIEALSPLVQCSRDGSIAEQVASAKGAVIVFAHMGPMFGVTAGLGLLGVQGLVLSTVRSSLRFPAGIESWSTRSSADAVSLFLKRGVESLAKGQSVIMAVDGNRGEPSVEVTMFGRQVMFQRGAGILRALTGAPVIPVSVTWTADYGITFHAWSKLPEPAQRIPRNLMMTGTMDSIAGWLEGYIRERPEDMAVSRLLTLTQAQPRTAPRRSVQS